MKPIRTLNVPTKLEHNQLL